MQHSMNPSQPVGEATSSYIQPHPVASSSSIPLNPVAFTRPTLPSNTPRPGASASLATPPICLPFLVQRLLEPGRATDETNDICISIILHPDLAKGTFALGQYSKMSGGLHNYTAGSSHAWLYTPRYHPNRARSSTSEDTAYGLALIFVFPEETKPTVTNRSEASAAKSKNKLHFGGRAFPMCNNRVVLQHGAHKPLGCVKIGVSNYFYTV